METAYILEPAYYLSPKVRKSQFITGGNKMRLGENIDPAMWEPLHLQSHQGLSESLGLKIGVTYVRMSDGLVATELTE